MIKRRFPATMELALWAVIPVVAGGIILGVIAAVNHNKPIDHTGAYFWHRGLVFPGFRLGLAAADDLLRQPGMVPAGQDLGLGQPGAHVAGVPQLSPA